MPDATLQGLVRDAELVAEVGVRLGRIKDADFFDALSTAREALDGTAASPSTMAALERALNSAIANLSPITLNDLRGGWRPFDAHAEKRLGTVVFCIFSFLLLVATAYVTQTYDRACSVYATTVELQETRGAEQAIRLFGLLRKNQQDVVESLKSGTKDFLYEAFNKALTDLELTNVKFQSYAPIASSVLYDLDIGARVKDALVAPIGWFEHTPGIDSSNPSNNPTIAGSLKNYGAIPVPAATTVGGRLAKPAPSASMPDLANVNPDLEALLGAYIQEVRDFMAAINVGFDPLTPNDYSWYLYQLRESMSLLGLWLLPGLYGMLGAVIFHMRRLLDATLPNPSWLRFGYRIVLGGFAGIIVVWFWTPTSQKLTQPAFATLTSFGLAFLVGFSTDVFFQALDRLVTYLAQAVGTAAS
jgi:hypothetical protein